VGSADNPGEVRKLEAGKLLLSGDTAQLADVLATRTRTLSLTLARTLALAPTLALTLARTQTLARTLTRTRTLLLTLT